MANVNSIAAAQLSDGRIQVFKINQLGQLRTRWKKTTDPKSDWTSWSSFQTPGLIVLSICAGQLLDKRPQLFAIDGLGNSVSCWKSTVDPNSAWTAWTAF